MAHIFGTRAHDYPGKTPAEHFSAILEDGMTTLQLAIPKSFGAAYPTPQPLLDEIKAALDERSMSVTVLGCYINPALPDADERRAQVDTYIKAMPAAHFLGARCIGTETTRFADDESERPAAMQRLTESVKRMCAEAEKHDVYVGIEPVASHTLGRPELVAQLIEDVNSDRLKIIFDPINLITPAHLADQTAFFKTCKELFGEKIVAVHVKDFVLDEAGRKAEAPLFKGILDWNAFFTVFSEYGDLPLIRDEGAAGQNKIEFDELRRRLALIEK